MIKSIIAVALGSMAGGLCRWLLSAKLNHVFSSIALGTLLANLLAAYIVGLSVEYALQTPEFPVEGRLLIATGFCGGLSTFSTFSLELVTLLQQGRIAWSLAGMGLHVGGSLLMTALGIATFSLFHPR